MIRILVSNITLLHYLGLTVGEDRDLWDERSLKEPERAMLCERPALVLPLTHEEQIHRHGLAVLSPHNTTLEASQQRVRSDLPNGWEPVSYITSYLYLNVSTRGS